jgi:polysaccharide biosynthesis protein PslG
MRLSIAWIALALACAHAARVAEPPAHGRRIEFSLLEDYDKGDDLADVARDFDLFASLGVRTWRGSFGWDDYEPSRGVYDFEWLHRFAELAESRGITLRPYIAYTPEWAARGGSDSSAWNDPPRDVEDWYRFVRALASAMRRHRNIRSYEIYNEENVAQWWDGPASAYAQVLARGLAGLRAGDPAAELLLGGMVFPDLAWLRAVCEPDGPGRLVDVIPFHAYPETWTPPNVSLETYLGERFGEWFVGPSDAACGAKRLWVNETGFATVPGRSEADQAGWWIRAIATFVAQPRIEHIGIYEIKDLAADRQAIGDAPNYHLGIATADRRPKIAFGTLRRLVSMIGSRAIAVRDADLSVAVSPPSANVFRHLFRRDDGRWLLFLWTPSAAASVDVAVPGGVSTLIEYGVDGSESARRSVVARRSEAVRLSRGLPRMFELVP